MKRKCNLKLFRSDYRRFISLVVSFFIITIVSTSCVTRRACDRKFPAQVKDSIRTEIVEIEKPIRVPVASDSGYLIRWIECVKNKPVIRDTFWIDHPGARVQPSVTLEGNVLTAKCIVDSFSVYTTYREKHVKEYKGKTVTVEKITNILTGLQNFLIWSGGILWIVVLIYVGYRLVRWYLSKRIL